MAEKDKTNYSLIAIVAIVGIVAIFGLLFSKAPIQSSARDNIPIEPLTAEEAQEKVENLGGDAYFMVADLGYRGDNPYGCSMYYINGFICQICGEEYSNMNHCTY